MELKPIELEYDQISLGDTSQFNILITEEFVNKFSNLCGDNNPLHMDEEYAKATSYKGRIVHGLAVSSFFSTLVGMYLPGKKCLYLSQSVNFKNPVRIGDLITVKGEVIRKVDSFKMLHIKTQVLNKNIVMIEGEAKVLVGENNEIEE